MLHHHRLICIHIWPAGPHWPHWLLGQGGGTLEMVSLVQTSPAPDQRLLSADWNGHCLLLQWAEKTTNVCNIGVIHTFDGYIYLDDCHCPLVICARAATRHQAVSVCPINSRQQSRFGKNNGCVECWVLVVACWWSSVVWWPCVSTGNTAARTLTLLTPSA